MTQEGRVPTMDLFRVLVAYDGSPYADEMLDGLGALGLPSASAVVVLSVADRWLPPPSMYEVETSRGVDRALDAAGMRADAGARKLAGHFPGWQVKSEAVSGSPAKMILKRAEELGTDLIVLGALGHSAVERFLIGSVSSKVANHAKCSVHVSRSAAGAGELLLIGYDGSDGADAAVAAVASRTWKPGTRAALVMALGAHPDEVAGSSTDATESMASAKEALERANLSATTQAVAGDPKGVLMKAAETAACLFVGANQHSMLEKLLLGTVSGAIVARARCSVEIVRRAR